MKAAVGLFEVGLAHEDPSIGMVATDVVDEVGKTLQGVAIHRCWDEAFVDALIDRASFLLLV